ncbi:metallophosphoesterase [Streptomyces sp. BH-SS-21]|uniref:Metallophosphoesterase n=1 Tax=Streptomyces liliiviolaceus TaxID=2823109 RepID=A0A941B1E4_9ACTN|nr:metallophosphoesterase [Streptomyces liliiviolaceus]MBQ0846940.1 metallophosphoesterase [Streptomyces liliiviolaceus]
MVIVFVVVVVLALAVFGGLHWYLWRRLVRDTTARPGVSRRVGTVVIVGGPLLMFAAVTSERTGAPFWLQQVLAWPGFLWMALSIYLLLALLVGEAVRPLLRRFLDRRTEPGAEPVTEPAAEPAEVREAAHVPSGASAAGEAPAKETERQTETGRPKGTERPAEAPEPAPTPVGPSRRLLISRVVGGAAAAAAVGTVGYGTYGVLSGPKVKRVTVPLAKLPRAAHGYRIAVVSDIHLGPVLGRGFAQKVVDTINSTQPDLIAVVGDLVDGSVKDLGPAAAPLAQLRARHGSFFVTGNHEYFSGAEEWVARVRELGLNPLENARTELAHFDLAGVNDVAGEDEGQGPDFTKALGDRDRARTCVLLAHQPVQIHDAVDHGVDLQLSGHTHGGQLWPGNLIADLANPTLAGLERYGDTQLYVSRGAGAWGPPTRVGAPSDITVVELASRQA